MAIVKNTAKTALDIYKDGYGTSFGGVQGNPQSSKDYYLHLHASVRRELEDQGFCTLLDAIAERVWTWLDAVAVSALLDLLQYYKTGGSRNPETEEMLPYVVSEYGKQFAWRDCDRFGSRQMALISVKAAAQELREYGRREHLKKIAALSSAPDASRVRHIPVTGGEEQEAAKSAAGSESAAADGEKGEEKKEETASAAEPAEERDAEREEAEAKQEAKRRADALTKAYLKKAQEELRRETEKALKSVSEDRRSDFRGTEKLHDEMIRKTSQLQQGWFTHIDDLQREQTRRLDELQQEMNERFGAVRMETQKLDKLKEDFYSELRAWQRGLDRIELYPLAELYTELYRNVNLDNLIGEEILRQEKAESPSPEVIEGLQKLEKRLQTYLRKFAKNLPNAGLYAFTPAEGEAFDEIRHAAENDAEADENARIGSCVVPGVAKKGQRDEEDEVIIPALVRLA